MLLCAPESERVKPFHFLLQIGFHFYEFPVRLAFFAGRLLLCLRCLVLRDLQSQWCSHARSCGISGSKRICVLIVVYLAGLGRWLGVSEDLVLAVFFVFELIRLLPGKGMLENSLDVKSTQFLNLSKQFGELFLLEKD